MTASSKARRSAAGGTGRLADGNPWLTRGGMASFIAAAGTGGQCPGASQGGAADDFFVRRPETEGRWEEIFFTPPSCGARTRFAMG